jgi:hypothetical protein
MDDCGNERLHPFVGVSHRSTIVPLSLRGPRVFRGSFISRDPFGSGELYGTEGFANHRVLRIDRGNPPPS